MVFELGKCYEHSGTGQIYICGLAATEMYGIGFVAEHPDGTYSIVGMDEINASNYSEITKEKYLQNFKE